MTIVAALAFGGAVFAACWLFHLLAPTERRRRAVVATVREWVPVAQKTTRRLVRQPTRLVALLERLGRRFASNDAAEQLDSRLVAGGLAGTVNGAAVLGARVLLTLAAALFALVVVGTVGSSRWVLFGAFALVIGAYIGPGVVIDRRARARRDEIARALPDALDLLAVTVEAGLGLFGAIQRLVEIMHGPLADEFALVLSELRVGQSSERALRSMAERLDTPEVTSFVRALVQGEKLGLSLAQTLENQASDIRKKRRAIAEERAGKAPVKMLFPVALFIFPALFIVILGPAAITLRQFL
jgi:tight adherence protein C